MMASERASQVDDSIGKWSGRFALVLVGWFASSAWYGTLHLKHVETVELPKAQVLVGKAKDAAGCEHWRADQATVVAKKAITGALVDSAPVPSTAELPKDNCPHIPAGK